MNRKRFWKNPKNTYILLGILAGLSLILYITYLMTKQNPGQLSVSSETQSPTSTTTNEITKPETSLSSKIDSILFTFGLKPEWITTERTQAQKKTSSKAAWFTKVVLIPKDLASAELNLDISTCLKQTGLSSRVNEEIISKDIAIYINHPDSTQQLPAAIIQVIHSDKVKRTDIAFAIILDKINEFSQDELDKLIVTKNEFSYVFPRNLDDIEIQHKLLQHKKDILINLTLGGKDNYEADFNTSLDEKGIREKVRNFTADFNTVNKVILTKSPGEPELTQLQKKVAEELARFNISVINDTMLTAAYDGTAKNKVNSFFDTLVQKAPANKYIIAVYPVDKSEFTDFYGRVQALKKYGYKFLTLSEYFNYVKEQQLKEEEFLEKQKQELMKKKMQENTKKKITSDKKDSKKKQTKQDVK